MNSTPLWSPTDTQRQASQWTHFKDWLATEKAQTFASDEELHAWSVKQAEVFWSALGDWLGLFTQPPTPIRTTAQRFQDHRWFPNERTNYAERLLSQPSSKKPSDAAVVDYDENGKAKTLSFDDLKKRSLQIASKLHQLGIKAGDVVACCTPTQSEGLCIMLGATWLGAVFTSCSPDFGEQGILDRFSQTNPSILFGSKNYQYAGKVFSIQEKLGIVQQQLTSSQDLVFIEDIDEWLGTSKESAHPPATQLPFNAPLFIMYTSGTTGIPKCIVHGVGGTLIQHLKELRLHSNLTSSSTLMFYSTMGWMMWNWIVTALAIGTTLVLVDGSPFFPDSSRMLDITKQEGVTHFGAGAKFYQHLLAQPEIQGQHNLMPDVEVFMSTGSPLLHENFDDIHQVLSPTAQIASISGGTDILSCFVLGRPNQAVYRGEIQGAGLGMDVRVFTSDGREAAIGEKGELVCTTPFPSMPIAFANDPDGTKYQSAYFDRFENCWAHGDFAEKTASNGFILHGRSDSVLNPGGVRIGTAEIYRVVEQNPEYKEALAVGRTTQSGDESILLFVILSQEQALLSNQAIQTLKQQIKTKASPRHVPSEIHAVHDFPRTRSGKICEIAVRDVIAGKKVSNTQAIANPDCLDQFIGYRLNASTVDSESA